MTRRESPSALVIDYLNTPLGGVIGLSQCPGRSSLDLTGKRWNNDLDTDIQAIRNAGFSMVVSLLSAQELLHHGAGEIEKKLHEAGIIWHQFPIADFGIPSATTIAAWELSLPKILDELRLGKKILIHCAGGLGRTGMMSANILVAMGVDPSRSIEIVRKVRPGAIETKDQENFVRGGGSLRKE